MASIAQSTGLQINTPLAKSALENVNKLHKSLTRISSVDGETKFALKAAQKALGNDITSAGVPELSTALNDASMTYAKPNSLLSLNKEIVKHLVPTNDGLVFNYKTLSSGLKRWSLSKDGAKALKYQPELKDKIRNIQVVISEQAELSTLLSPPQDEKFLSQLLGNNIPSILSKNMGGILGTMAAGPVGGLIGEGMQIGLWIGLKGAEEGLKAGIKTKPIEKLYRKGLQRKLSR